MSSNGNEAFFHTITSTPAKTGVPELYIGEYRVIRRAFGLRASGSDNNQIPPR